MKRDGWYASRSYPHFDLPLTFTEARAIVTNPDRVRRHGFHPFLRFDIVRRRYRAGPSGVTISQKSRPIGVAAHVDGYIFAYYAKILGERYEAHLTAEKLESCVLAYRSGLGSNIEFAKAAFDEIERRDECVVIAFDLESFFDSIDHATLKQHWVQLLSMDRLPPDHYSVFNAITRYSEVSLKECRSRLGIGPNQRVPWPICSPLEFRKIIRKNSDGLPNLVVRNTKKHGIPQGSQISALLSNVYMLPFDSEMNRLAFKVGGYYRRYSDDILWICHCKYAAQVEEELKNSLRKLGDTTKINEDKTERSIFWRNSLGHLKCDRPIQYLGFTFDGTNSRIQSQTLSRFWRNVIYAVRAARRAAGRSATAPGIIYKRKIYRLFTHLGRRNLITYAKRSEAVMHTGAIRAQVRRHVPRIARELRMQSTNPGRIKIGLDQADQAYTKSR
jgi:RNA-directed DNA polymerase